LDLIADRVGNQIFKFRFTNDIQTNEAYSDSILNVDRVTADCKELDRDEKRCKKEATLKNN